MGRALATSARVIGGLTAAVAMFALGVGAMVVLLGMRDVYADDAVIEHRTYKQERVVEENPVVVDKRTRIEERRTVVEPAPETHVVERRTRVETVPAPIIEKRTTVEVVPPPAVIEKRTIETIEEDD